MDSTSGKQTNRASFTLLRSFPEHPLAEEVRRRVARGRDSLGFFLGPAERRTALFKRSINLDRLIVIQCKGRIVGHATFSVAGKGPFSPTARDFQAEYGSLQGLLRFLAFCLTEPRLAAGELYLYTLKVDAKLRGQGGGTMLLEAVAAAAAESGCDTVTLQVAGHNPAVSTYRRNGFVVSRRLRLGPLRLLFPFADVLTMKRVLR